MASLIFWQRTATRDFRERERLVWGSLGTERGVLATKKRNIIWGFGFFFFFCDLLQSVWFFWSSSSLDTTWSLFVLVWDLGAHFLARLVGSTACG
jgi:hypothetical protein